MTIEQKVAQLFIVRPEALAGGSYTQAGEDLRAALENRPVGGLIYFSDNLVNSGQTAEMLAQSMQFGRDINGLPLFLCVDEEGGSVTRISGYWGFDVPDIGNMSDVGASGDLAYAKQVAMTIAGYLGPLGFNVDFAPVCDIANNPYSNVMSYRSFGSTPEVVAPMVAAQVEGFLEAGILCSAKHFPGIGAAEGDSHDDSISTSQTLEGLQATELVPFEAAINAEVPFIMVGHISVPAVTGTNVPASISPEIIHGLLRQQMGYEGLIITDSLEMGAIDAYYGASEVAVGVFKAGADMALMPANFEAAFQGVMDAISSGELSEDQINASVLRVLRTKLKKIG